MSFLSFQHLQGALGMRKEDYGVNECANALLDC